MSAGKRPFGFWWIEIREDASHPRHEAGEVCAEIANLDGRSWTEAARSGEYRRAVRDWNMEWPHAEAL
jgi:hypothetical protein